jgi:hypothetical protein
MLVPISFAQSSPTSFPNLVRYEGTLHSSRGATTASTTVGVTFAIYKQQEGGAPVWMETQNVTPDTHGNYSVLLGNTTATGLPSDLFSAQEQRWLGVQVQGEAEQPRVMLVSVPYAFKAHEADTLGGKPASAFAPAQQSGGSGVASETSSSSSAPSDGRSSGTKPLVSGHGAAGYIAYWKNPVLLGDSVIYQSASGTLGVGTDVPPFLFTVSGSSISGAPLISAQQNGQGIAVEGSASGVGVLGASSGTGGYGVEGQATDSTFGVGVYGTSVSTGYGVEGVNTATSGSASGVYGQSYSTTGSGVAGVARASTGANSGVLGISSSTSGYGVEGDNTATSGSAVGVFGQSASPSGYAVLGTNTAASGLAWGVYGQSTASVDGIAVEGHNKATSGNALGVFGTTDSPSGVGLLGVGVTQSNEAGKVSFRPIGVWGDTSVDTGVGVLATADFGIAFAGYNDAENISTAKFQNDEITDFNGNVLATKGGHFGGICEIDVSGNFGCTGSKSAVVPVDGGTRKVALYAVEAPENWFEDIGSAQLSSGAATVQLESTFAQTVNSGMEYHVFLTPNGDCKGLYVANKTADSFEVRELGGGKASIAFDYRIVARRKGYETIRLADKTKQFDRIANEPGPAPGKVPQPRLPQPLSSTAKQ